MIGYKALILNSKGDLYNYYGETISYKQGQSYEINALPKMCVTGYHFCSIPHYCFHYYDRHMSINEDEKIQVFVVKAYGEIATYGDKSCTNKLQILHPYTGTSEGMNHKINTSNNFTYEFVDGFLASEKGILRLNDEPVLEVDHKYDHYKNFHAEGGPAKIERPLDNHELSLKYPLNEYWYHHGKLHREDGPAVKGLIFNMHLQGSPVIVDGIDLNKFYDVYEAWYCENKLHREDDGPAIVTESFVAWYKHGVPYKARKNETIENKVNDRTE